MKSFFSNLLGVFTHSWWIEISTSHPQVVYYFGPFDTEEEALEHKQGYIEDLQNEGAEGIQALTARREEPDELTVEVSSWSSTNSPVYSA